MTNEELYQTLADLNLEDINLDGEGRIIFANPHVAKGLKAAAKKSATKRPRPKPNTNCVGCNVVRGCGPTNTVKNCGCGSLK